MKNFILETRHPGDRGQWQYLNAGPSVESLKRWLRRNVGRYKYWGSEYRIISPDRATVTWTDSAEAPRTVWKRCEMPERAVNNGSKIRG